MIVEATLSLTGQAEHLHLLGLFGRTCRTTPQEQAPPLPFCERQPTRVIWFPRFCAKNYSNWRQRGTEYFSLSFTTALQKRPPVQTQWCEGEPSHEIARSGDSPIAHPSCSPPQARNTGSLTSSTLTKRVAAFLSVDGESILAGAEFVPPFGHPVC